MRGQESEGSGSEGLMRGLGSEGLVMGRGSGGRGVYLRF